MNIYRKMSGIRIVVTFLSIIGCLLFSVSQAKAEPACIQGGGHIINNIGEFYIEGCVVDPSNGIATGRIFFEGQVVHSGSRNALVGNIIIFDGLINKLTIAGPYAGYEGSGTLTLCDREYNNCTGYTATLFPPGSNVKDTARDRGGVTRGFDDFNISIVYGENIFVTANGFVDYCYDSSGNKIRDCVSITP